MDPHTKALLKEHSLTYTLGYTVHINRKIHIEVTRTGTYFKAEVVTLGVRDNLVYHFNDLTGVHDLIIKYTEL